MCDDVDCEWCYGDDLDYENPDPDCGSDCSICFPEEVRWADE